MSIWLPWIYQYAVGGVIFVISLVIALRTGALRLDRSIDRRLLIALVTGLLVFMAGHAAWIAIAAPSGGAT
jgi:ABC-type Mn2+/Zn2+ transport system permease subunit